MAIQPNRKKSKSNIPAGFMPFLLVLLFFSSFREIFIYLLIGSAAIFIPIIIIWGINKILKHKKQSQIKEKMAEKTICQNSKGPAQTSVVSGVGVSQSSDDLAISQYSQFPRYYNIDGMKYDIDNPEDIKRIPLIKTILNINGEDYGMDALLHEHGIQSTENMDLYWATHNKVQEYRNNGIIHKSLREIQREQEYLRGQEERKAKEDARKKQCDTFTVDDMQQFPDIPIAWSYVTELQHTDGVAWCQLNWNNQKIVLHYISQINDIIVDAQYYVDEIGDAHIDLYSMDFDYPVPMYMNSMCNTRIECYPYTATGKLSKYPAIIQFATKPDSSGIRTVGEIKILRDGNIGAASVSINGNVFKIGLHGTSLVLKRIDNPYMGGNLFKFSETYD